jgi:2-(1,2-epoxy-1,2-dihydrophenyl)acetyl-CoA isomerase
MPGQPGIRFFVSEQFASQVHVGVDDGVATVTLNRPERHNSLVPGLLVQFLDALSAVTRDPDVYVVVLRAAGRSFSTGGDLQGFLEHADDVRDYSERLVGLLNDAIIALFDCRVPVIAAVDGQVTGGALGLVLAADIVLVTEHATFRPYYVDVGFSPDGGWTALLPEIIGRKRASAVQLLNQEVSADQALEWGLATAYADSAALESALAELCGCLRSKRAGSIQITRRLLRPADLESRLDAEKRNFVEQIDTDEALNGVRAFLGQTQ